MIPLIVKILLLTKLVQLSWTGVSLRFYVVGYYYHTISRRLYTNHRKSWAPVKGGEGGVLNKVLCREALS